MGKYNIPDPGQTKGQLRAAGKNVSPTSAPEPVLSPWSL